MLSTSVPSERVQTCPHCSAQARPRLLSIVMRLPVFPSHTHTPSRVHEHLCLSFIGPNNNKRPPFPSSIDLLLRTIHTYRRPCTGRCQFPVLEWAAGAHVPLDRLPPFALCTLSVSSLCHTTLPLQVRILSVSSFLSSTPLPPLCFQLAWPQTKPVCNLLDDGQNLPASLARSQVNRCLPRSHARTLFTPLYFSTWSSSPYDTYVGPQLGLPVSRE